MSRVIRWLLRKRTIIASMSLVVVLSALSLVVPQSPESLKSVPAFAVWVIRAVGFDHVVTSVPFMTVVSFVLLQLMLVSLRLIRRAIRRLLRSQGPASSTHAFTVADEDGTRRELRRLGYLRISEGEGGSRWVRHPWGFFGASLLHLGMTASIVAIIVVGLTQSAGWISLAEGGTLPEGSQPVLSDRGLLAPEVAVRKDISLESVDAEFWPDGSVRQITSRLDLGSDGSRAIDITVNEPVTIEGTRYYQDQQFGYAFFLTIASQDGGAELRRLDLAQPRNADSASYLDLTLSDGRLLRAKLTVDEAGDSGPALTLRLQEGGTVIDEAVFDAVEGPGSLGDLVVTVDDIRRWSVFVYVEQHGVGLLFASFFVIFLGAFMIYATPPREVTITREEGQMRAYWYASRFAEQFITEEQGLRTAAGGGARATLDHQDPDDHPGEVTDD